MTTSNEQESSDNDCKYIRDTSLNQEAKNALIDAYESYSTPLSMEKYRQWKDEKEVEKPSASVIVQRIGDGKWKTACKNAGIESPSTYDRSGSYGYSPDTLTKTMQEAAAEVGEPLTKKKYRQYRSNKDNKVPSVTTIVNKIGDGSWINACENAGIQSGTIGATEGDTSYSRDQLITTLKEARRSTADKLTARKYQEWKDEDEGNHPGVGTIANRLGD